MIELLPCPFCGCTDIDTGFSMMSDGRLAAGCNECGATGPYSCKTEDETTEQWNRRALPPALSDDRIREIQRAAEADALERAAKICEIASNIGPGATIDKRVKRCEIDIRALAAAAVEATP